MGLGDGPPALATEASVSSPLVDCSARFGARGVLPSELTQALTFSLCSANLTTLWDDPGKDYPVN